MHIAIITAGGAGMFCGSCMHDNTWARALMLAGCEVSLVPTYTPIRVDEPDQSELQVFYGGLNVYLRSRFRLWRRLPAALTRWLDRPGLINWATSLSISNDAAQLGPLTLDMLAGENGPHAAAGVELAEHIACALRPDAVIFSNALLSGALAPIRRRFERPILCTLQGDDVFLDGLPDESRRQAIDQIRENSLAFDGFFVHSRFYRDFIVSYLSLPAERFHQLPLGIDLSGHDGQPGERADGSFTVGYFARIAPEKGLHHLAEAFVLLQRRQPTARLRVGGYLGSGYRAYFNSICKTLGPVANAWEYVGSPETHAEKVRFLRSLDVLSVPTEFEEPKGLYVLESLANGVPVVQPSHGAFPELIEATQGGLLVPPRDPLALAEALERLMLSRERRVQLGTTGQANVRRDYNGAELAARTIGVVKELQMTGRIG
jgi:glycosyltransferase involved in cell wall biosynthesis